MDRLIRDAMRMDSTFKANTKTVIKNKKQVKELDYNYADIVKAIHIVQTNMGITGTTAQEAADTIQGSVASTKAAWENLLTAMGKGGRGDISKAIKELVGSAGNVLKNVKPVVTRVLKGVRTFVWQLAPMLAEEMPKLLGSLIPNLIYTIRGIVVAIGTNLPTLIKNLVPALKNTFNQLVKLVESIAFQVIMPMLGRILGWNRTEIQDEVARLDQTWRTLKRGIKTAFKAVSIVFKSLWKSIQPILSALVKFLIHKVLPTVAEVFEKKIVPIVIKLSKSILQLWSKIRPVLVNVINWIMKKLGGSLETIIPIILGAVAAFVAVKAAMNIGSTISKLVGGITKLFGLIAAHPFAAIIVVIGAVIGYLVHLYQTNEDFRKKVNSAWEKIKGYWENTLKPAFESIYTYIKDTLLPWVSDKWETVVKPAFQTAFEAIAGFWNDTLKPALEDIYTYIKDTLIPWVSDKWETVVKPAFETVFSAIAGFWNDTLKPALEDIYTYIKDTLIPWVSDKWETVVKPTFETVFSAIAGFWEETLKPAFVAIYEYIKDTLIPWVSDKWETVVKPAFETVFTAISNFWDTILKPAFEAIGTFISETLIPAFGSIGDKWTEIKDGPLQTVIDFLSGAFTTAWDGIKTFFSETLPEVLTTIGAKWTEFKEGPLQTIIDFLGDTFQKAWDALGTFFTETLPGIIETIGAKWTEFKEGPLQTFSDFISGVFTSAWSGLQTFFSETLPGIIDTIGAKWTEFKDGPLQTFASFVSDTFTAAWSGLQTFFSETLPTAIDKIKLAFAGFYATVIVPIADFISGAFTAAWADLKDFWETTLQPKLDALKLAFASFYGTVIKPIADFLADTFKKAWETVVGLFSGKGGVDETVGGTSSTLKTLYEKWLVPIANWLGGNFLSAWEGVKTFLGGFIDFLTGVFSGDWEKAWQGLVDMVSAPFNTLKDVLKVPINAVIRLINRMLAKVEGAINSLIRGINSKLTLDFSGVYIGWPINKQVAAFHWSPDLKEIEWGRIKELAKGGSLGSGETAIVGEYAPELLQVRGGRAVVTPLANGQSRFGQEVRVPREQARDITIVLELDRQQFAKAVYKANNQETQRVGVRLANGGAY